MLTSQSQSHKNNQHDCQYFSIDKFNETFNQNHGLSIIHFNCRSLPHNFDKVKDTLNEMKCTFDIIALTGTWLILGTKMIIQLTVMTIIIQ